MYTVPSLIHLFDKEDELKNTIGFYRDTWSQIKIFSYISLILYLYVTSFVIKDFLFDKLIV